MARSFEVSHRVLFLKECSKYDLIFIFKHLKRWIKYEQRVDSETDIWSKPFVGALVYQSLLYLKTGLQYGTVLLKCDHDSLTCIFEEMIQDFIDSGHMNKENKDQLKKSLLSRHRSNRTTNNFGSGSGSMRKKSTLSEFFPYGSRRQSTFTAADHASENLSGETSRKSSAIQLSDLNLNKAKNKKLSMSDANLLNNKPVQSSGGNQASIVNEASVKFENQSPQTGGSIANSGSIENNTGTAGFQQSKRRRSTIALIKSTLTQSKLNKVITFTLI